MILNYPEDSAQDLLGGDEWWATDTEKSLVRGRLIRAYVPHVDQIPKKITAISRADDPTSHNQAIVEIAPLRVSETPRLSQLPVAALPIFDGEQNLVYRAKRRPLLVLGEAADEIDRAITQGKPKWQTSPTVLVAPFYGVDEDTGRRSGFSEPLVRRVRQCEYAHLFWEKLPLAGTAESLLRLDHIQPVGTHYCTIELTQYRLGQDALCFIDEYLHWFLYGDIDSNGLLYMVLEALQKFKSP